jgi:hypothetical protein
MRALGTPRAMHAKRAAASPVQEVAK